MLAAFCCLVIFFINGCIASQTGELPHITPFNVKVEPGANISFFCNLSSSVSSFSWTITDHNDVTTELRTGIQENSHSSKLTLNNVGISPALGGYNSVQCKAGGRRTGTVLFVGYAPLAPKLECAMEDLHTLHCRWNNCDPRVKNHPEWQQPIVYNVTYWTTHYLGTDNTYGICHVEKSKGYSCSSFCSVREDKYNKNRWRYWRNVIIMVNGTSEMGTNFAQISFTPTEKVVLSSPVLKAKSVSSGSDGEAILVWGNFSSNVPFKYFFDHYYQSNDYSFEVRYKDFPLNTTLGPLKTYTDEDFWNDWNNGHDNDTMTNERLGLMVGSRILHNKGKEVMIRSLPGNSLILVGARWKLSQLEHAGYWSTYNYCTYHSGNLKPPAFYQASLFFLEDSTSPPALFDNSNFTSSVIMIWQHTEQSKYTHKNVSFRYQTISDDARCLSCYSTSPKSSNFMKLNIEPHIGECRLKLTARNNKGVTSAPVISPELKKENCIIRVISVKFESLMQFNVTWYYFSNNSSANCSEKLRQEKLNITLFFWREQCTQCDGKVYKSGSEEEVPSGVVVHTFIVKVKNTTGNKRERHDAVDFRVKPLLNKSLTFSFPFLSQTAYKIAVSLSRNASGVIYQSASMMTNKLFYYNVARPSGAPPELNCSEIGEHSMKVSWRNLRPQERNGPVLGYEIYYTTNKKCFLGHNTVTCGIHYDMSEGCNRTLQPIIYNKSVSGVDQDSTHGWKFEEDDKCEIFSVTLKELQRNTNYYIGVLAYNAAGKSHCFKQIIQATRDNRMFTVLFILICLALSLLCLSACAVVIWRRRRRCFWRQVPRPVLRVSLVPEDNAGAQMTNREMVVPVDVAGNYVNLSEKNPLKIAYHTGDMTNGEAEIFGSCYSDHPLITNEGDIIAYVKGDAHSKPECNHDLDSLGSDVPGCSTPSTANGSNPPAFSEDCDAVDSDEDNAIYTSPEIALIISSNTRRRVEAINS